MGRGVRAELDRKYGMWIEFGVHPDGRIDIQSEPDGTPIAENVRREDADRIMADRERLLEDMAALIRKIEGRQ